MPIFDFFGIVIIGTLLIGGLLFGRVSKQPVPLSSLIFPPSPTPSSTPTPIPPTATPTPTPFTHYNPPQLPKKDKYAVFLVGDSMTAALGPHPYRLSQRLNAAYPNTGFIIDNYAVGSKNILSLEDLLNRDVEWDGHYEPPAFNRDFDILLIESFANNPLSDLPIDVGLKAQWDTMDAVVTRLLRDKPNAVIILVATVAPSDQYGKGSIQLPPELRKNYAAERRKYLENFIAYAKERNFPLVNAYDVTRLPSGDAKPGFISRDGYIHPSQQGVEFMQDLIADFIVGEKIIPPKE